MTLALELREIHKSFGSVHAVRGADFSVARGQLHALLGENGAGKSTLMHIAAGLIRADQGEIRVDGKPVVIGTPRHARRLGIGMVHQHFTSVPAFTVSDNIALASGWPLRPAFLARRVTQLSQRVGLSLDPAARAETLSVVDLQRLEILKVLSTEASTLLLDEPTGSLAPAEADGILSLIRKLVEAGSSAVLITHKLEEALKYADHITVLRRGRVALSAAASGLTSSELAMAMLGEDLGATAPPAPVGTGAVVILADRVTVPPLEGRGSGLLGATFEVRAGETVGVAAVAGNGERELLRSAAGLTATGSGHLRVESPISFVPEDRTTEGIIAAFSLTDNFTLGFGEAAPWVTHGVLHRSASFRETSRLIERYGIVASGVDTPAGALSGGNQQKLILARALEMNPRVIIAENPGRGLDIRAARDAFERLRAAARSGAGVLIYSSDLDELIEWCDRILVVVKGQVLAPSPGASRETIGRHMLLGEL